MVRRESWRLEFRVHREKAAPFSSNSPNIQADNDLPVHLKGGATDNILYRVTMTLCLGGECRMGVGKGLVPGLGFGEAGWTVWDSVLVNREGAP